MEVHRLTMKVQAWTMEVRSLPLKVCNMVLAGTNKKSPSPQMK